MFCPNCRRQLPDGTKFCGGCGTALNLNVASEPAEPVSPEMPEEATVYAPVTPVTEEEKKDVKAEAKKTVENVVNTVKTKVPKKVLMIAGIAVAAVLVIALLASIIGSGSSANYVLYIKDEQIYFNDFSKNAPYEITSDLMEDAENSTLYRYSSDISNSVHITEDGKTMFYLDKADSYDGTATLFYRSLSNMKKEPVKIDGGVSVYAVSEDGKVITYLKGDTLYQHNLKEETKIAKDINDFYVSEDGKIIYYYEYEDESIIYAYYKGEEEKIGSDISLYYISEDYKTVYYMDEDTLYKKELGKDKVKLVTDVYSAFGFVEDGSFYYIESVDVELADYFDWEEDYEYWKDYMTEETSLYYTLYYFDGKNSEVVADACSYPDYNYSEESCAVMYTAYSADVGTFSMEELEKAYYESYSLTDAALSLVQEAMSDEGGSYIAINGVSTAVDLEDVWTICFSPDGKAVYALCDVEDYEGDLYKASVSGTKVGEFEEIDDSVSGEYGMYFASSSGEYSDYFYYFKDVKGYEGELCVNGESVSDDAYVYSVRYNKSENSLMFYIDYNSEKGEGTLCAYNGKKVEEIADDVYNYRIGEDGKIALMYDYNSGKSKGTLAYYNGKKIVDVAEDVFTYAFDAEGNVLYLYDYSTSSYRGNLASFNGKKSTEIDEDVVALIVPTNSTYHYLDD